MKKKENQESAIEVNEAPVKKGVFEARKDGNRGVQFPDYWKKKKLNSKFVAALEESAKSEPVMKDRHGEYRVGTFLHGCAVVIVAVTDDLWSVEIHSEHPVGLPMLQDVRYKFAPDAFLMAYLLPSKKQLTGSNMAVIYQIPGSLKEKKENTK